MSTYNPYYSEKNIKDLRTNARGQLIGKYPGAILITLMITTIELIITSITDGVYTGSTGSYLLRYVISLIVDLLMGVLMYGQTRFFLHLVRGIEPLSVSDLFYGFKHETDKAIVIQALFTLASFVGSIPAVLINTNVIVVSDADYYKAVALIYLFDVVVMFVAKLFCGLSFYILSDHPEYSAMECFKESINLMTNKKGKYFLTYLSVIPITIVGVCAFFIGVLWTITYYKTLIANFYLDTIGEEPFNPLKDKETEGPTPDFRDYQ